MKMNEWGFGKGDKKKKGGGGVHWMRVGGTLWAVVEICGFVEIESTSAAEGQKWTTVLGQEVWGYGSVMRGKKESW